jgi:hypothetical protein
MLLLCILLIQGYLAICPAAVPSVEATQTIYWIHAHLFTTLQAMVAAFEKQDLHMTSKFKYCDSIQYIFLISSLLKKSAALFYLANNSSKSYPHVEK